MKRLLLLTVVLSTNLFATTFVMPATMDAGSVQAKLKELLYEKLEKEGPITGPYQASLTGDYNRIVLEDKQSKIECEEFSNGVLAVQNFKCVVTVKNGIPQQYATLNLEETMDSASTQAVLKEVLFNELEQHGPVTDPYTANLTGSYGEVQLQDKSTLVTCTEHSVGMLAVQGFACEFVGKK